MLVGYDAKKGYGINNEGRVIKQDRDTGEFRDRKIGRRTFENLGNEEQRKLLDILGTGDRGWFGTVIDNDWMMLDENGNQIKVSDYKPLVTPPLEVPPKEVPPKPKPQPEPEERDDPTRGRRMETGPVAFRRPDDPITSEQQRLVSGTDYEYSPPAGKTDRTPIEDAPTAPGTTYLESGIHRTPIEAAPTVPYTAGDLTVSSDDDVPTNEIPFADGGLVKKRPRKRKKTGKGLAKRK